MFFTYIPWSLQGVLINLKKKMILFYKTLDTHHILLYLCTIKLIIYKNGSNAIKKDRKSDQC